MQHSLPQLNYPIYNIILVHNDFHGRWYREHGEKREKSSFYRQELKEVDYFPGFRDETMILEDLKISHR